MENPFVLLSLSIAALVAGPVVYIALRRYPALDRGFQWVIAASIIYLVGFHVLPEVSEVIGSWVAWPLAIGGMLLPYLAERFSESRKLGSHSVALGLALVGLFLHATTDGVALGLESMPHEAHDHHHHHHDHGIGWAVVLHRIPVGAAVYGIFLRRSQGFAIAAFGSIVVATLVGFFFGAPLVGVLGAGPVNAFQAFAGGVLLHVVFHKHGHEPKPQPAPAS
jgi:hypothetical protein